jgi:hypothetical protein
VLYTVVTSVGSCGQEVSPTTSCLCAYTAAHSIASSSS